MSFTSPLFSAWIAASLLAPVAWAEQAPPAARYCAQCVDCEAGAGSARTVRVNLYNQSRIGSADILALFDVANRIWRPYGVNIVPAASPDAVALVVVSGRPEPAYRGGRLVMGDTLFHMSHATPYIRVWLEAAETLASDARMNGIPFVAERAEDRDRVLAQIMGVALAHELGHYLLDTAQHSDRGLLRQALTAEDFQRPLLARLELTPAQQQSMCNTAK